MHIRELTAMLVLLSSCAVGADVFAPEPAGGPPTLSAVYPTDGGPPAKVGKISVAGVGKVAFYANLEHGRLFVKAVNARETQIGRAETVVGIGDTSMYIQSPRGLFKVVIRWKTA